VADPRVEPDVEDVRLLAQPGATAGRAGRPRGEELRDGGVEPKIRALARDALRDPLEELRRRDHPPQSSQSSTVIGTPQERWREMHQSGRWAIMPAMRSRPHAGIQRTRSICSSAASRSPPSSIEMNHWLVARKMTGCLQRQQCG